jgi:hypothetical protein
MCADYLALKSRPYLPELPAGMITMPLAPINCKVEQPLAPPPPMLASEHTANRRRTTAMSASWGGTRRTTMSLKIGPLARQMALSSETQQAMHSSEARTRSIIMAASAGSFTGVMIDNGLQPLARSELGSTASAATDRASVTLQDADGSVTPAEGFVEEEMVLGLWGAVAWLMLIAVLISVLSIFLVDSFEETSRVRNIALH